MNSLHVADEGFSNIPIIDISPLVKGTSDRYTVAAQIGQACHECGFF
jgi:isopenicillin N synthase-like dioxygenase